MANLLNDTVLKISDIGEKALIRDFIKPFFNSADDPAGVGDDCAMVEFADEVALFSTDRVPSDLIAFRLGILDYYGLGMYLARLNLSDIAACGGRAVGLLLNLGLPSNISERDIKSLCRGFAACAAKHGAEVLGGDITSASELSISATSIGKALRGKVLSRREAKPGDSIFISRPLGVTPAALLVFRNKPELKVSEETLSILRRQFTDLEPMLSLGLSLAASGKCGACMDNTDGIGQTLLELSEASKCAFIVQKSAITITSAVKEVCQQSHLNWLSLAFNGGADFSLVGTIRGEWSSESASAYFKHPLEIVGRIESGYGVWLEENDSRHPLEFKGWNYFSSASTP